MDALILSCGTGGGHNSVGKAICEELSKRGHHVKFLDPYSLQSHLLSAGVSNAYIHLVQRNPYLFGLAYLMGDLVRHLPGKSPVYYVNRKAAKVLEEYLEKHHFDLILTPHLYPAQMLTYLKKKGKLSAKTVFVATDYTCIPFTEETECDYYIIPGKAQIKEFVKRGIPREKIKPFGIPVASIFYELDDKDDKREAKRKLGLSEDKEYILLAGGSIGAGKVLKAAKTLIQYNEKHKNSVGIVVCGNNKKLYKKISGFKADNLIVLGHTDQMALYMKASRMFLSKAGGLSSTEAAVIHVPLIHIPSIPGCETHNRAFFSRTGMSIAVKNVHLELINAMQKLDAQKMTDAQKKYIPHKALYRLCDWIETQK